MASTKAVDQTMGAGHRDHGEVSVLQTCSLRGHDSFAFLVDLLQHPVYHQPLLVPN